MTILICSKLLEAWALAARREASYCRQPPSNPAAAAAVVVVAAAGMTLS